MKKKKKKLKLRVGRLIALIGVAGVLIAVAAYGGIQLYARYSTRGSDSENTETTAPVVSGTHAKDVSDIKAKNPGDTVSSVDGFTDEELRSCFYSSEIDDKLHQRLNAMGYEGHEEDLPLSDIRYIRVLYKNFDNQIRVGEIMVNASIAQDVEEIFFDLFTHDYQIGKMLLPDAYGGRMNEAFADNSTTGLCFGLSEDSSGEMHAYGLSVDLNPLYNPLIKDNGKSLTIYPMEGQLYIDRTTAAPHYISADDYAYKVFTGKGFSWKGTSTPAADYKHFEKGTIPEKKDAAQDEAGKDGTDQKDDAAKADQQETLQDSSQPEEPAQEENSNQNWQPEEQPEDAGGYDTEPDYEDEYFDDYDPGYETYFDESYPSEELE